MDDRERFVNCVLGEPVDRPPFWLFWGPWGTTWLRWEKEGKPAGADHRNLWNPDPPPMIVPVNCGPCPTSDYTPISADDASETWIDRWGVKRRNLKNRESMSEFLEWPVKCRRDWERYKEEKLDPDHPDRVNCALRALCGDWIEKGYPIQLGYFPDVGIFGSVRWLLGDEECLVAFCTMPDLVHEIMDHLTSLYLTVFAKVVGQIPVDVIHIWEDMCSRQGPLISPQQWETFMGPQYRRIKAFADAHGIPVISVDTDGRPDLITPLMMRAGVNLLFPLEVAAGCDVNVFRREYPLLAIMGGIDKRALADGPRAIDRELERIRPALDCGRYIPDLDHLIPDDVSWRHYCYYADALKKLVGKA
jgi:uroporphyrinogen decarboxylase